VLVISRSVRTYVEQPLLKLVRMRIESFKRYRSFIAVQFHIRIIITSILLALNAVTLRSFPNRYTGYIGCRRICDGHPSRHDVRSLCPFLNFAIPRVLYTNLWYTKYAIFTAAIHRVREMAKPNSGRGSLRQRSGSLVRREAGVPSRRPSLVAVKPSILQRSLRWSFRLCLARK
jgi:hypothetical protein